ncbi:MAG: hypothetical protein ACI8TQ_001066 [Planctomycetota bacterium]|jgi:hypothetical protein
MNANTPPFQDLSDAQAAPQPTQLARTDIGLRVLYSFVFAFILNILAGALTILVVLQLIAALVTREAPRPRLKQFGQLMLRYFALIVRYVTFNDDQPPFPFADFPAKTPEV